MIHERLDLERWIAAFPLPDAADAMDTSSTVSGPVPVAYVEQARRRARAAGADLGPPVPCDLCVWNLGDGPREATKIGGTPYWPAAETWPHLDRRTPLTFVAQLCFADSRDILPALPGDLLSVFAVEDDYATLYVRWHRLDARSLLSPRKMPAPSWAIEPCHAVLHRTAEYPAADGQLFKAVPYPLSRWARRLTACTKLGGTWLLRGELPDPADSDDPATKRELEAAHAHVREQERQFIGQLGSITLTGRQPFVNVANLDAVPGRRRKALLTIADVGGYDFFFDGEQTEFSWWSG